MASPRNAAQGHRTVLWWNCALQRSRDPFGDTLLEEKAAAMRAFEADVAPLFETGQLRPNLDRAFPFAEVRAAHEYLESNLSFGKVVLEW